MSEVGPVLCGELTDGLLLVHTAGCGDDSPGHLEHPHGLRDILPQSEHGVQTAEGDVQGWDGWGLASNTNSTLHVDGAVLLIRPCIYGKVHHWFS